MSVGRETEARASSVELAAAAGGAAVLLAVIGCVAVFSATAALDLDAAVPPHFMRHGVALAVGAALAFATSRIPLRVWYRASLPLWFVAVATLVWTAVAGLMAGGAQRWVGIPGLGVAFQPGEFAKLATILATAALLSHRSQRVGVANSQMLMALGLAAVPAALCLMQPDLGTAVILFALSGMLVFVAGAHIPTLIGPALVGLAGVGVYSAVNAYAMRRWVGFLDPWERSSTEGFQLVQSFVAFGRGGLLGVGVGSGRQKLFYLPEAHTDFILSVIAEEAGLVGVLLVLGGFVALGAMGLRIALRSQQRFPMLLGFGATSLLVVPAALNAAVVMGLIPTKGLTLPLLSYGRTSLMVACISLGLLFAVARETAEPGSGREASGRRAVMPRARGRR